MYYKFWILKNFLNFDFYFLINFIKFFVKINILQKSGILSRFIFFVFFIKYFFNLIFLNFDFINLKILFNIFFKINFQPPNKSYKIAIRIHGIIKLAENKNCKMTCQGTFVEVKAQPDKTSSGELKKNLLF